MVGRVHGGEARGRLQHAGAGGLRGIIPAQREGAAVGFGEALLAARGSRDHAGVGAEAAWLVGAGFQVAPTQQLAVQGRAAVGWQALWGQLDVQAIAGAAAGERIQVGHRGQV